jgi:hypothetical protein
MCSQRPPHFKQILTAGITPPAKRIRKTGNAVMSHRFAMSAFFVFVLGGILFKRPATDGCP